MSPNTELPPATLPLPSPPRRRWKALFWLVGVAAGLVVVLVLAALLLVSTPAGARFGLARISAFVPGSLEIGEVSGLLRGPLEVRNVSYRSGGMTVSIDRVYLEWRLGRLLAKRIDIDRLDVDGVHVVLPAEDPTAPAAKSKLPDLRLPVNVALHQANIRDIELVTRAAPSGPAVPSSDPSEAGADRVERIESIELSTTASGDRLVIDRLELTAPTMALSASGWVEPQGDYLVALEATWSATLAGLPPLAGSGSFSGSLESLRIDQRWSQPAAIEVGGVIERPLRDLSLDLVVAAAPFVPGDLLPIPPGSRVGGNLRVRGELEALRLDGQLSAALPDIGELSADLDVTQAGEVWQVASLVLTSPSGPVRVDASGTVRLPAATGATQEPPSFDLTASWVDLRWPLSGPPQLISPRGTSTVVGTQQAYDLALNGRFELPDLPPIELVARGRGDASHLDLASARAEVLDGTVQLAGRVAWSPEVAWQIAVNGRELDPVSILPGIAGRLGVRGRTEGRWTPDGAVATFRPLEVTGALRGQPVVANAAVEMAGEIVSIDQAELTWGSLTASAEGQVMPQLALDVKLTAPNLGLLADGAGGAIEVDVALSGAMATPRVVGTLVGSGLVWGELSVRTLELDADLDLDPAGQLALTAVTTGAAMGQRATTSAKVALSGRRDAHRLTLVARGEDGDIELTADGALDDVWAWKGKLAELAANTVQAGGWRLVEPVALSVAADRMILGRLCLQGVGRRADAPGRGQLCASGGQDPEGWRVEVDAEELPLALVASLVPTQLELRGPVNGRLQARGRAGGAEVSGEAKLVVGPGEIVYLLPDGERETLRFGASELVATANAAGVVSRLVVPLPEVGQAEVNLELPGYQLPAAPSQEQRITGKVRAELTDLGFLQAFAPQVEDSAGRLAANFDLGGSIGEPLLVGNAMLTGGRASLPELGVTLENIELRAASEGSGPLAITGTVRSGEGTLTLTGTAPPAPSVAGPVVLTLAGRRFQAMSTRELDLVVSPQLELRYDGQRVDVTGEVLVPHARVNIKKRPPAIARPSPDVIFVDSAGKAAAVEAPTPRALAVAARVRVRLGSDVKIAVLGLEAEPRGTLLLVEEPGKPASATGEITVEGGTFEAYGQDLTIERGRLVFGGPITRPRADLRAFRRANDGVVAGLEARGPLATPEITLWSEPPMDQANQLAYLMLGRPLEGAASAGDGDLVANAATALGLKGADLLAKQLATRWGLEEARIDTRGGLDQASLVLGKYLAPRLFVSYAVGLFAAVDTLRVRYELTRHFTLQATRGSETGADLLYTIERGDGARRRRRNTTDAGVSRQVPPPAPVAVSEDR